MSTKCALCGAFDSTSCGCYGWRPRLSWPKTWPHPVQAWTLANELLAGWLAIGYYLSLKEAWRLLMDGPRTERDQRERDAALRLLPAEDDSWWL